MKVDIFLFSLLTMLRIQEANASKGCGYRYSPSKSKIISSVDAADYSYPWMVSLHHQLYGDFYGQITYCGGSLISKNWVLTAGHCVYINKYDTYFVTGTISLPFRRIYDIDAISDTDLRKQNIYRVNSIAVHPDYRKYKDSTSHQDIEFNDIALISPTVRVQLSLKVQPICLPEVMPNLPSEVTAIGFGLSFPRSEIKNISDRDRPVRQTKLQVADMYLYSKSDCIAYVSNFFHKKLYENDYDGNCVGLLNRSTEVGPGLCYGDSGSGIVKQIGEVWSIVGISSYGLFDSCLHEGNAGFVTDISLYKQWICTITSFLYC